MKSNIDTYDGVPLDEQRQQDSLRAQSLALRTMLIVAMITALVGSVLGNDALAIGASIIAFAGIGSHEFAMRKSDLQDYVTDELARNENLRRRWLKRSLRAALLLGIVMAVTTMLEKGGSTGDWLRAFGIWIVGGLLLHFIERMELRRSIARRVTEMRRER